ncbi:hypothetical protein B7P43_G10447 [Cryptotermes secundus]|uniref:Uncharacterized protein n=1 Tax=Cryptotermes secundus TaxID=105785 RepID=A0A2J7PHH2_9NEOP|nr:uncharacterized protein LOC117283046 [Cryptotermes secundus]PNF15768.1 hypothetical protein B7P43_G10447 [Cryptotermes secundus]
MILHHPTVVTHIAQETFKTMTKRPEGSITELRGNNKEVNGVPNIIQNLHDLHFPSSCRTPFPDETDSKNCKENTSERVHDVWLNRFHILKQRESSLRLKEFAIDERERAVTKKEKQVALLDRLIREKMTRADVYLRQCREARSVASVKNLQHRQYSTANIDLDTSLSADPGDTSILPTSTKLNPEYVTKPSPFVRVNSEKHVHFNTLPITKPKVKQCRDLQPPTKQAIPQSGLSRMSNQVLHDIQEHIPSKVSKIHDRKELQENRIKNPFHGLETANEVNFRNDVLIALNSKHTSRSSNSNTIRPQSCMEDLTVWLENKRHAYHLIGTVGTQRNADKENTAVRSAEVQEQRVTKSVGVSASISSAHKNLVGSLSSFR